MSENIDKEIFECFHKLKEKCVACDQCKNVANGINTRLCECDDSFSDILQSNKLLEDLMIAVQEEEKKLNSPPLKSKKYKNPKNNVRVLEENNSAIPMRIDKTMPKRAKLEDTLNGCTKKNSGIKTPKNKKRSEPSNLIDTPRNIERIDSPAMKTNMTAYKDLTDFKTPPMKRKSLMLSKTPNSIKKNMKGESQLQVACNKGDINLVAELLEAGAEVNTKDNAEWTPLHDASKQGHADIVEMLLEHGANVNATGDEYHTPLIVAVQWNQHAVARILLDNGADVNQWYTVLKSKSKVGDTGLSLAKAYKNQSLYKMLFNHTKKNYTKKVQTTSTINRGPIENAVLLTSAVVSFEQSQNVAKLFNGTACTSIKNNKTPTHLIVQKTDNNRTQRTLKYLYAVCHGIWIVNNKWLEACLEAGSWVPEEDYEVIGVEKEDDEGGPKRSRLNKTLQYPGLFSSCHFFLSGRFTNPNMETISELLKISGAEIVKREPKADSDKILSCQLVPYHAIKDTKQFLKTYYILYDDFGKPAKFVDCGKVMTVSVSWLLRSMSTFMLCEYDCS